MSSASGVVINPGSKPRGAGVRTICFRKVFGCVEEDPVYGDDVVGQVDGLGIGDGMVRVFGDLLGALLWNGVLEVVIEDVVVDVAENHDEDDDVSVDESAIGEAWV